MDFSNLRNDEDGVKGSSNKYDKALVALGVL